MVKKLSKWVALAFIVFYVASSPEAAADLVKQAGAAVADGFRAFGEFVTSLAG
jgi:hypothetical protein